MKNLLTIALILTAVTMHAAEVRIAWNPPDPPDNVAGYKIYYGTKSRWYDDRIDVGNATTGTVTDLDPTQTYYFAITAYNASGNESDYSAELVWDNLAPILTGPDEIELNYSPWRIVMPDLRGLFAATDDFTRDLTIMQKPEAGEPLQPDGRVTLSAVDEAGNTGTVERVASVKMAFRPVRNVTATSAGEPLQRNEGE